MAKEIRKETNFLGEEREIIYENGAKVGEIREEKTLLGLGETVKREYNNSNERVSETRTEKTFLGLGPDVDRTYSPDSERLSESRNEKTLFGFGPTVERTYGNDGERISEARYERKFFGLGPRVKRVENVGKRTASEILPESSVESGHSDGRARSINGKVGGGPSSGGGFLVPILVIGGLLVLSFISHQIVIFLVYINKPDSLLEVLFSIVGGLFFLLLSLPAIIIKALVLSIF